MTPLLYQFMSDWSKLCIPYCTVPSAMSSGMLSDFDMSRMFSRTAAVLTRISAAGTRPGLSLRGTRRREREHAVDRLRCVGSVKRRENEVACVGRLHRSIERVQISNFTDEQNVG